MRTSVAGHKGTLAVTRNMSLNDRFAVGSDHWGVMDFDHPSWVAGWRCEDCGLCALSANQMRGPRKKSDS